MKSRLRISCNYGDSPESSSAAEYGGEFRFPLTQPLEWISISKASIMARIIVYYAGDDGILMSFLHRAGSIPLNM